MHFKWKYACYENELQLDIVFFPIQTIRNALVEISNNFNAKSPKAIAYDPFAQETDASPIRGEMMEKKTARMIVMKVLDSEYILQNYESSIIYFQSSIIININISKIPW